MPFNNRSILRQARNNPQRMLAAFLVFVLVATGLAASSHVVLLEDRADCATGVHVISARASEEDAGPGAIGAVASAVVNAVPGSDSVAVDYPATVENYQSSKDAGIAAMTNLITSYVASCPDAKIVLLGYSQGAQVLGDTLIGATGNTGLDQKYRKNIVAAVQMGDPDHSPGLSINNGTSTNPGMYERANGASYTTDGYASKMVSYCDTGDEVCDSGNSPEVHESYVQTYGTAATNFVVRLATKAEQNSSVQNVPGRILIGIIFAFSATVCFV